MYIYNYYNNIWMFDEYSFKQLCQEKRGQWQKCYSEASMSIYYYLDVNACSEQQQYLCVDENYVIVIE